MTLFSRQSEGQPFKACEAKVRRRPAVVRRFRLAACAVLGIAALPWFGGCTRESAPTTVKSIYSDLPNYDGPAFMRGTFAELAELNNIDSLDVSSFGLVGQLQNTGDCTAATSVRQYMTKEIGVRRLSARAQGASKGISAEEIFKNPAFAIVRVDAWIPPGARKGDWIDATVSTLPGNKTSSLVGGRLFEADLKLNGADMDNPAGAVNTVARVAGPITVNPVFALQDPRQASAEAKSSLRTGTVMLSTQVMQDRPIRLQMRKPERQKTRLMQRLLQERFQYEPEDHIAQALDEGVVEVYVPKSYRGDWQHFGELIRHMPTRNDAASTTRQAKLLAEWAAKPEAQNGTLMEDISYCFEALGTTALPSLRPLINSTDPKTSYFAARAAAFIDNSADATQRLQQIAKRKDHPYRLLAVRTLGALPKSLALHSLLRELLDSEAAQVRIEAYRILARNGDPTVNSTFVAPAHDPSDQRFVLDIVPGDAPPLIYVSRTGTPRIAILGRAPDLNLPMPFTTLGNRMTLARDPTRAALLMYYRDARYASPIRAYCQPDLGAVIARLGGMGDENSENFNFSFGEVAAIVQALATQSKLIARDMSGRVVIAAFMMQVPEQVQNQLARAALANNAGRPGTTAPQWGTPADASAATGAAAGAPAGPSLQAAATDVNSAPAGGAAVSGGSSPAGGSLESRSRQVDTPPTAANGGTRVGGEPQPARPGSSGTLSPASVQPQPPAPAANPNLPDFD